jgi:hypothetical protein
MFSVDSLLYTGITIEYVFIVPMVYVIIIESKNFPKHDSKRIAFLSH